MAINAGVSTHYVLPIRNVMNREVQASDPGSSQMIGAAKENRARALREPCLRLTVW